jgi:uncharacterized protein
LIGPSDFVDDYVVMPFRSGKLDGKFLVTTDAGCWALLSPGEFGLLQSRELQSDPDLFASLRAAGIIATREDFPDVKKRMREKFWFVTKGTTLHVVAVTNDCNLACKYCYSNTKSREKMSVETARKVADFIIPSRSNTHIIEFSGGEPLLNFEAIKTVVERSRRLADRMGKELGFAMIHNGTGWNDERMEFFMKNRIGICFSLDGPEDLHDLHRPYRAGGGTYRDVVKWVGKFRHAGYESLNAIPVITRHSLRRGREIVDEYLAHGFTNVRFKYLSYFGRAPAIWDEIGYRPAAFVKAWKDVIEYMFELNQRGIPVHEDLATTMAKKLFLRLEPGNCEMQMPCGAGIGQLAYSPDGSVYTCDEGRMFEEFRIGDVDMKHSEVMKNAVLRNLSLSSSGFLNLCGTCELRPFCGICPLESYNQTGTTEINVAFNRRHKMHKEMLRYLIGRSSRDPEFRGMLEGWARSGRRSFFFGGDHY